MNLKWLRLCRIEEENNNNNNIKCDLMLRWDRWCTLISQTYHFKNYNNNNNILCNVILNWY